MLVPFKFESRRLLEDESEGASIKLENFDVRRDLIDINFGE